MKKVYNFGFMAVTMLFFVAQSVCARLPAANPVLFSSHGFTSIYLNANGYNPVFSSFSGNPATSNPAGFSSDDKIHIWGKWAKNTEIKDAWFGYGYRQLKPEVPSGLGVSIPFYGFTFTAGYSRPLNYTLYSENIPHEFSTIPGATYDTYSDARLEIYSVSVSGNLALPGSEVNNLAFGLTLKYGTVTAKNEIFSQSYGNADDNALSFAFGALYSLKPDFAEKVRLGFFAETKEHYSGGKDVGNNNFPSISGTTRFVSDIPTRIHAGAEITYQSGIQSLVQASLRLNEKSGFLSKNQIELATSVFYPVTQSVSVSGGLLWDSWLIKKNSVFSVKNSDVRSVFLTTGVHAGFQGFLFDLALADNHLLSGKYRKQTVLTAGIGCEF